MTTGLLTSLIIRLGVTVAVTAGVLLVAHGLAHPLSRDGRWALPAAIAVGYASGHALIRGWPSLPAAEAVDWLAYLSLAAGLAGVVAGAVEFRRRPAWRWAGTIGLTALALAVLLGRGSPSPARLAVVFAAWVAAWSNASALAGRLGPGVAPPLALVAAGSAVVLALSGSVVLGALGGVATAAIGSAWAVGKFERGLVWDRGAVGVAVTVVGGLLTVGLVYGEAPVASALLLAAAPAGAWVDRPAALSCLSIRRRGVLRAAAVGLLVALAVAIAARVSPGGPY